MRLTSFALAVMLASTAPAQAQGDDKFDGAWNVTLTCPANSADDDDARGYTHHFPAEVRKSLIRGTHKAEGQPGWHFLHGRIHEDGSATLHLDGIVNNPRYAINNAQRGKAYTYRIEAQFEATKGTGQRLTGRVCEFTFTR